MRRWDFRFAVVAAEVAIAEIVSENDDDIRRLRCPHVAEHNENEEKQTVHGLV